MQQLNFPLSYYISDPCLLPIANKIINYERLTFADGLLLYNSSDLTGIGAMAHNVRLHYHGRKTYYAVNRRISCTNICNANCQFCAFQARPEDAKAYTLTVNDIVQEMAKPENLDVRELHMTAGLNSNLSILYFEDLFKKLKHHFPKLHLKALSMVEIDFYAKTSNLSIEDFLDRCLTAGLESCPGGGAEIFNEEIRSQICKGKSSANSWLQIAKVCHSKKLPTNCTMLYGHIEKPNHKVEHLLKLRDLQDQTNGFLAYIPLAYQPKNNQLSNTYNILEATGKQNLREIAIGRLLLDNIPHIKAYWVMITEGTAQISLNYGANDMDGTVINETIAHDAGAKTPNSLSKKRLEQMISAAGFTALERDSVYNVEF